MDTIDIVICIVLLTPFIFLDIVFALAMKMYIKKHSKPNHDDELEACKKAIKDEFKEVQEVLENYDTFFFIWFISLLTEFTDLQNAAYKYALTKYYPKYRKNEFVWLIVFWFVIPTGVKCAIRYLMTGTIRSERNRVEDE